MPTTFTLLRRLLITGTALTLSQASAATSELYAQASGNRNALEQILGPADLLLPSQISVLKRAGEQFNLYTRQLVPGQWWRLNMVEFDGPYGKQIGGDHENDAWRIEPNGTGAGYNVPTGTFTLTATVRDGTWATQKTASSKVTVLDPTANQNAVRVITLGDSITYRGQFQSQIAGLGGVTLQGIRQLAGNTYAGEGRGGWKLTSDKPNAQGGYLQAGSTAGYDSPFMFPDGVSATNYRGNVAFWKKAVQVAAGTLTAAADVYDFGGFGPATKEGGESAAYDAGTGYPLNPVSGWVVFDPGKAAGSQFQTWNGSAWTAATQPKGWSFSFANYLTRYAWAFTAGAPTHVTILLGANDFVGATSVPAASLKTWLDSYQSIVTSIHAASRATNVILALPSMPALQDGEGDSYGSNYFGERMRANYQTVTRGMLDRFDTDANRTAKTFVSLFGAGIDPYYGYSLSAPVAPNKYVTDTSEFIRRNLDGIHPASPGMKQGGDWLAATVQATR